MAKASPLASDKIVYAVEPETLPPRNAKFILLIFLSKKAREACLGDLEETFYEIVEEFGPRRAKFWYWSQIIRSLSPWIWTLTKRVGIGGGGFFGLNKAAEYINKILGS